MVNIHLTDPDIFIDGTKVPRVTATRCLGAHLCFNGRMEGEPPHLTRRWDLCQRELARIAALPLPLGIRSRLMAAQPCASAFYGTEVTVMPMIRSALLSAAVTSAIWSGNRRNRCQELVMTLLAPGHLVDPQQALTFRRLAALSKIAHTRVDLHQRVATILLRAPFQRPLGPVGLALEAVARLGWTWSNGWIISCGDSSSWDLTTVDPAIWCHAIRDALRMLRWREASARRPDLRGIEQGIDRDATNVAWRSMADPRAAGVLRSTICGAVWTQERRSRGGLAESAECPHCHTGVAEDLEHLWWTCPA